MILYGIQFTRGPLSRCSDEGPDENDLDWTAVIGHQDYLSWSEADEACSEFNAAFEYGHIHRIVETEVDAPELAKTFAAGSLTTVALTTVAARRVA
jgi:hypothetical protein